MSDTSSVSSHNEDNSSRFEQRVKLIGSICAVLTLVVAVIGTAITYAKVFHGTDSVVYKLNELNRKFDDEVKLAQYQSQSQLCTEAMTATGTLAAVIEQPSAGAIQKNLFYGFYNGKMRLIDNPQVIEVLDKFRHRIDMENDDTEEFKLEEKKYGYKKIKEDLGTYTRDLGSACNRYLSSFKNTQK